MPILAQPSEAPKASPAIEEQSITAFVHAEILTDLDTGQPTFCVATDQTLSDFQAATASQGLAAARKLREEADRIEALANKWATHVLQLFIQEYGIEVYETNFGGLAETDPELAADLQGYRVVPAGGPVTIVLTEGLSPTLRLGIVRDLVRDLRDQA